MLQIISGKFFDPSSARHSFPASGILYSNLSRFDSIQTSVATLEPVYGPGSGICAYVVRYVNQIEKQSDTPRAGELVRVGDDEILSQFELFCIAGLYGWFASDRLQVELQCRTETRDSRDQYAPSHFLPNFFKLNRYITEVDARAFIDLINKAITLKRDTYNAIISYLGGLRNALQAINYNIDLAYSMIVYCLESLGQEFQPYTAVWQDYDPSTRHRIEQALQPVATTIANDIKAALLDQKQFKLTKRFVDFVESHIEQRFFEEDAEGAERPIRKSELRRALANAYQLRSSYVHALKPIHEHLRLPKLASHEVLIWEKEPYLSFAGLFRVAIHVLRSFIWRQPIADQEKIDWRSSLPGIVKFEVAPQYWIWRPENLTSKTATSVYSGFLHHITETLTKREPVTDMTGSLAPNARSGSSRRPAAFRLDQVLRHELLSGLEVVHAAKGPGN